MHRLIRSADVLVENFIPGKLANMGLGWDDCHELNPKLIYASISGTKFIPGHRRPLVPLKYHEIS